MPDIILVLGSVLFQDFEVPSGIGFGGRQRLTVHRLPGGTRVIDALGRDDAQITFSGFFSGPDATLRARSLDEARVAGVALPITWDVFFYTVLISDFRAEYQKSWWVPYRITCTVLRDEASAVIQPTTSIVTSLLSDLNVAAGEALNGGVDLSSLQGLVAAPNATIRSTAAYTMAQTSMIEAQTAIDASINIADAALPTTSLFNADTPEDGASSLLSAVNVAGQLSSLTTARAYVDRAAANLAYGST